MKKKLTILLALILGLMCILTGCGEEKIEPQTVKIAALAGPTGMGMAPMIVDKPTLADGVELDFTVATSADQITADISITLFGPGVTQGAITNRIIDR